MSQVAVWICICAVLFLVLGYGVYRMLTHTKERAAAEAAARAAERKQNWPTTRFLLWAFVALLIWSFAYGQGWIAEKPPFLREPPRRAIDGKQ